MERKGKAHPQEPLLVTACKVVLAERSLLELRRSCGNPVSSRVLDSEIDETLVLSRVEELEALAGSHL